MTPGRRLLAYARFHLRHVHYTYEYLGVNYFEPPLPDLGALCDDTLHRVAHRAGPCLFGLYDRRVELRLPWLTKPDARAIAEPRCFGWAVCSRRFS